MTDNSIKMTAIVECEITVPDWFKYALIGRTSNLAPQEAARPPQTKEPQKAFPDTLNGRIANRVAHFIRAAGSEGVTRHQITRKFGDIKSSEQRKAVLKLLPSLLYRTSRDPNHRSGKPTGAERWTYFYSNNGEQE